MDTGLSNDSFMEWIWVVEDQVEGTQKNLQSHHIENEGCRKTTRTLPDNALAFRLASSFSLTEK